MKLSIRNLAPLVVLEAMLVLAGCGEKPSFVDDTQVSSRTSGDQQVTVDGSGNPIRTGASGRPGGDDMAGTPGGSPGGSAEAGMPGDETTTGDKEPSNEGNGSGDDINNDAGVDGGVGGGKEGGGVGHTGDDGEGDLVIGTDSDDGATDMPATDGGSMGDDDGKDPDGNDPNAKKITREMTFPSHMLADGEATQDLAQAYLTQNLILQRNYVGKSKQSRQITRPVITDNFDQGHSGAAGVENFTQRGNRPLDILVVVDNSNSMQEEQVNLGNKLTSLLTYVNDTDWTIGVVTTDPNQTCLRRLIKKGDADALQQFYSAVTAGTAGSNNERGILTARRSLEGTCLSQPWIRSTSTLAVLFVTDEDNCSDGNDCPGKAYTNANYLGDYLASIRVLGQNARVYGIFWHPSETQAQCPTAMNKANIYASLVSQTNGTWGSICDNDYSNTLAAISQNINVVLNSRFTLQYQPDPSTVHVYLNNVETMSYTLTGKVLEIAPPPADGTVITVTYRYGSVPMKSQFGLRYKPVFDRIAVNVDGMLVPPAQYAVDAAAQTVTFAAPPAERAKIQITYARDVALNTQYLLLDNIKAQSLVVKVEGNVVTNYTVNEALGLVTFDAPPAENALLDFAYTAVGAPILEYPFATLCEYAPDMIAYDTQTGAPVRVTCMPGKVVVHADDYFEGRNVTLRYDNLMRQQFQLDLSQAPIPGTVVAMGGGLVCNGAQQIQITGTHVSVAGCGFPDDTMSVTIRYQHVTAAYTEFTFTMDNLPADNAPQEWKVWVNDQLSDQWTRTGNVIKFPAPQASPSTIRVQLTQNEK